MLKDNLLIIHHGALGDVVVAFPVLIELKKNYRRIEMICDSRIGRLARALNVVDKWYPLEASVFSTLYSNHVDILAKDILISFSEIILFSRSLQLQETLFSITGKAVYRIPPRPDVDQRIHVTAHLLSNLAKFGLLEETDGYFSKSSSSAHKDRRDPQYDRTKIFIHPGSGSRKKCWPVSNFIKIALSLDVNSRRSEFILGPAEFDLADILSQQEAFSGKIHKMDDLVEAAKLLKTGCDFIGNDSGISHLAAFLGLSTVVIFGPSDPERWRPVGRNVIIIRPKPDCSPCFETNNAGCKEMECFKRTSPEDVMEAYYRIAANNNF